MRVLQAMVVEGIVVQRAGDAWVRHGASKREADALMRSGDQLGGMTRVGLE